mmetsp:Transcript_2574/g.5926  ORF Transcript_2574/g.5926 Transcript_2574/m.5926 type:complete len:269 (-) Transcript_2574:1482-2288(-)
MAAGGVGDQGRQRPHREAWTRPSHLVWGLQSQRGVVHRPVSLELPRGRRRLAVDLPALLAAAGRPRAAPEAQVPLRHQTAEQTACRNEPSLPGRRRGRLLSSQRDDLCAVSAARTHGGKAAFPEPRAARKRARAARSEREGAVERHARCVAAGVCRGQARQGRRDHARPRHSGAGQRRGAGPTDAAHDASLQKRNLPCLRRDWAAVWGASGLWRRKRNPEPVLHVRKEHSSGDAHSWTPHAAARVWVRGWPGRNHGCAPPGSGGCSVD